MWRIKRIVVWLSRILYCKGFGIQSPSDFSFVVNVINERLPYYAYKDLKEIYPNISWEREHLCKLYFRIANNGQPKKIVCTINDEVARSYIKAGCKKSEIVEKVEMGEGAKLWIVKANEVKTLRLSDGDMIVIEGIKKSSEARKSWKEIKRSKAATVTFDLYYVGIVIADSKRYKKDYKINY